MRYFFRNVSGFTLVEVMVSLVIFLVTSMGLLPLLLTNIQANHNLSLYNRARHLTSEVMAEIQVMDYASLGDYSSIEQSRGNFLILQQVDPDTPIDGQSRITVTTRWQQKGRTHSYQLQTIRTQP